MLESVRNKKILGLIGSRQVGKTSLLYLMIENLLNSNASKEDIFYFNPDNFQLHEVFNSVSAILEFINYESSSSQKYIFIDEVQRFKNPGLFLKELYDLNLNIKIIFSGSSQIEIKSKIKENLVGRLRQFEIQRLSLDECVRFKGVTTKESALKDLLTYGGYPEVVLAKSDSERKQALNDIFYTYIRKDIVEFLNVESPNVFNNLLIMLASQIGQLLKVESLARALKVKSDVVNRYIDILEDTFIIKRVYPFYKNNKKELTKTPKLYFLDLGIRNLLIKSFLPIELREDKGALFENFYFLKLVGEDVYKLNTVNFWRTTNGTEIDFIVRAEDQLKAIETKWSAGALPKSFATIEKNYPGIETSLVDFKDFI